MTNPSSGTAPEFPSTISKPAARALAIAGISNFEQLSTHSAKELLALHGVGSNTIRILGEELAVRGLAFRID
ncbi:DNA-binding protein [Specibacter sp. NPDC078709]|uniref:DNA-binding protein n=1 Tax=Specibacter sp. NPDC078709 TaxID=3154364 RepID=UPI00341B1BF8